MRGWWAAAALVLLVGAALLWAGSRGAPPRDLQARNPQPSVPDAVSRPEERPDILAPEEGHPSAATVRHQWVFGATLAGQLRSQRLAAVLLGLEDHPEVALTPSQVRDLQPLLHEYSRLVEEEFRLQRTFLGLMRPAQRDFLGEAHRVEVLAGPEVLGPSDTRINPYLPRLVEALQGLAVPEAEAGDPPAFDRLAVETYVPTDFLMRGIIAFTTGKAPREVALDPVQARHLLAPARRAVEVDDALLEVERRIFGVLTGQQVDWAGTHGGLGQYLPTARLLESWARDLAERPGKASP